MFWRFDAVPYFSLAALLVAIPSIWLFLFKRQSDNPAIPKLKVILVALVVILIFMPAIILLATAGPYDNDGSGGLMFGAFVCLPTIALISAIPGLCAGYVVREIQKWKQLGSPDLYKKVAITVSLLVFVPFATVALWIAVGLFQTG